MTDHGVAAVSGHGSAEWQSISPKVTRTINQPGRPGPKWVQVPTWPVGGLAWAKEYRPRKPVLRQTRRTKSAGEI